MNEIKVSEGFQKVTAKSQRLRADGSLNIAAGLLSFATTYKPFDKAAYKQKQLKQSQKDWVDELEDADGIITVTITNEFGKYPIAYWLSNAKAIEGVSVDGDTLTVPAGSKYECKAGVIIQS